MKAEELAQWLVDRKARGRILIVEDNHNDAELTKFALGESSRMVDWAKDATEAIQMVRARDYELALVDLSMPGMDGLTFCRFLREHYPKIHPVVLSGSTASPLLNKALEERFIIVPKPLKPEDILRLSTTLQSPSTN